MEWMAEKFCHLPSLLYHFKTADQFQYIETYGERDEEEGKEEGTGRRRV
jgi:hypothetical protein